MSVKPVNPGEIFGLLRPNGCARPYGAMAQWQALILFGPYQRVFSLRPLS